MSRTSRVPYHQNVYDMLDVMRWSVRPDLNDRIADWEARTRLAFPASMKEFYSTSVTVRLGGDDRRDWTLTLPELWSEYSNDEKARALDQVLEHHELPRRHDSLGREVDPGPYLWVMTENQGVWLMEVRLDGSDDPPILADEATWFEPSEVGDPLEMGWHEVGRFSEVISTWFGRYYVEECTPISYRHGSWRTGLRSEIAPPKPYANGLWLRAPAEPFEVAAIDFLIERLDEPEQTPRPGNVTTYTFRPPGGILRVTADEPGLSGGLSAWWIHAETPERLAELGRPVLPFGTLRESLRADTDAGRRVLQALRSG